MFLSGAPEYGSIDSNAVPVLADVRGKRATALPTGEGTVNAHSPAISPDGSTIAYVESSRTSVPRLRILSRTSGTSVVLKNGDGENLQVRSRTSFFSADGQYLLFTNTDALDVSQPYHQAAVYDKQAGDYKIVSRNNQGDLAQWYAYPAGISDDGRFVYFWSDSPNLPDADSNGSGTRLFRRDTIAGKTIELQKPGEPPNVGLSENGRYIASAEPDGIRLIDYQTGEETLVPLPNEVMPEFCQQASTLTFVSNDAQRFYIQTCQEDPYSAGVLWSFDRSTNEAVQVAGPLVGNVAPFGDLRGIVFDGEDRAVPGDANGHDDVYIGRSGFDGQDPDPENVDRDGDALPDKWETEGFDYDNDGTADVDLPAMGANPLRKDLFVETDWLRKESSKIGTISLGGGYAYTPSVAAVSRVVGAFRKLPVTNPDGSQGISLHIDAGPTSIMNPATGEKWENRSGANAITATNPPTDWAEETYWTQIDGLRNDNVEVARRGIFHYAVYVDSLGCDTDDDCVTGYSRGIPGHDVLIARGDIDTDLQEAVTLAHELGHNLGLGHGGRSRPEDPGSQHVNEKANYLSIMNYFYSNKGLRVVGGTDGIIAFSSREHEPLYRDGLSETNGLEPDPFEDFEVDYRCPDRKKASADSWASVDWDCDGSIANGSSNGNIQSADEVTRYRADGQKTLGSKDYDYLKFWGIGSDWDARNIAMIDRDQPGTTEPTVEQAKADGVWWPDLSVQTDGHIMLTAYADTGVVDIPVRLANPGSVDFTVDLKLTAADSRFALENSVSILRSDDSATVPLRFDTTGVTGGSNLLATIEYSHAESGVLGSIEVTAHVPSVDELGSDACGDGQQAKEAQDLPAYQVPSLDAFLATCQNSPPPTLCSGKTPTPARHGVYRGRPAIFGTSGNDVIIGTDEQEIIRAGGGKDTICAGNGHDIVYAGSGPDHVLADGGNDTIYGENGADRILGGSGDDKLLSGGTGDDLIDGNAGDDHIHGDDGDDDLRGADGNDDISGGRGQDSIDGGAETDRCSGEEGKNVVTTCEFAPTHKH